MPTLYSVVNETRNRNHILELCKFQLPFWLMHCQTISSAIRYQFSQILHEAKKCGCFDAYSLSVGALDRPTCSRTQLCLLWYRISSSNLWTWHYSQLSHVIIIRGAVKKFWAWLSCRHQLARLCALFSEMLKVYCWLTLCLTRWQLQRFTTVTYFTNCVWQLKRSGEESCPTCRYFCTTMHLIIGHMLDRLNYLKPDLKKCAIQHILLIWHRVITICLQI